MDATKQLTFAGPHGAKVSWRAQVVVFLAEHGGSASVSALGKFLGKDGHVLRISLSAMCQAGILAQRYQGTRSTFALLPVSLPPLLETDQALWERVWQAWTKSDRSEAIRGRTLLETAGEGHHRLHRDLRELEESGWVELRREGTDALVVPTLAAIAAMHVKGRRGGSSPAPLPSDPAQEDSSESSPDHDAKAEDAAATEARESWTYADASHVSREAGWTVRAIFEMAIHGHVEVDHLLVARLRKKLGLLRPPRGQ